MLSLKGFRVCGLRAFMFRVAFRVLMFQVLGFRV